MGKNVKDDDDEKLVMVGDGVGDEDAGSVTDDSEEQRRAADAETRREEDRGRQGEDDEDDEDDDDPDERVGHGDVEETVEQKRERRRQERKDRKERDRRNREMREREIRFLRTRNEQVERQLSEMAARISRVEDTSVSARVSSLRAAIKNADAVIARATEEGDGEALAEAIGIRDELKDQLRNVEQLRRQAAQADDEGGEQSGGQRRQSQARESAELPPASVEAARRWHARNKWFNFDLNDDDSYLVKALEDRLYREGLYDPTSDEYYHELDRRIARALPHRAQRRREPEDGDERRREDEDGRATRQRRQPSGPKFRVGGQVRDLKPNEVHVSAERRKAMEDAGVWDDPKLRERYLKQYAKYDREHGLK